MSSCLLPPATYLYCLLNRVSTCRLVGLPLLPLLSFFSGLSVWSPLLSFISLFPLSLSSLFFLSLFPLSLSSAFALSQILKHEWPHNWAGFIPELVEASKTGEVICENNMQILKLLSEEVFDFSKDQMRSDKIKSMKESLTKEFSEVYVKLSYYTLYTPCIHLHCHICTYICHIYTVIHPVYMYIQPYIHLTRL